MPGCGLLIGSTSRYSHGGHDVVPRAPTAAAAAAWHVAETDTTDGASMEPRGCTRWQPVANRLERVGAENSVRLSPELDPGPARIPRHPASQSCQRLPSLFHARARIPDCFELGKVDGLAPEACERRIRGAAGYAAILYSRSKPPSRSRRRRRSSCGNSACGAGSLIGGLASGVR